MFTNRYITKGVQSEIPVVLQLFMWDCINAIPEPKDYLQIFRLSCVDGKQKIIHETSSNLITSYRDIHLGIIPISYTCP